MIDEKLDIRSEDEIRYYQFKKIREILATAAGSKFYQEFFAKNDINVHDICSLEDFSKIPQINASVLQAKNLEMLTVPISKVAHIFSSGGTTGSPKLICYDQESWIDYVTSVSRRWDYMGVTNRDIVGVMSNFDGLSLGGPTQQRSLEYKGIPSCCIGTSTPPQFAALLIDKLGITFLNSLTATMITFTEKIQEMGYKPYEMGVKKLGVAGEPLSLRKRQFLESAWGCEIFDKYGATEVGMFASECRMHKGNHLLENMLYFETVVPGTNSLSYGEGELVVTSLINKAMPLIRYNLGDIVVIENNKCECGFKSPRIFVKGRSIDTIYLQDAVKLTHEHFDAALSQFPDIGLDYQVIHDRKDGLDTIKLRIEVASEMQNETFKLKISKAVSDSSLPYARGVQKGIYAFPEVEMILPGTLERTERLKIKDKVIDLAGSKYGQP